MLGQSLRHHRKTRLEQGAHGKIMTDQLAEKRARLLRDPFMKEKPVFGIKFRIGRGLVEAPQFEPLIQERL